MNLFYLDDDPIVCAKLHTNKHIVKMILEYAQMLSTAHHELDGGEQIGKYRATHKNHPSTKWVRSCHQAYEWTLALLDACCNEYTHRYGKIHKTEREVLPLLRDLPTNIAYETASEIPQCMPDEYKVEGDSLAAYHNYYNYKRSLMK